MKKKKLDENCVVVTIDDIKDARMHIDNYFVYINYLDRTCVPYSGGWHYYDVSRFTPSSGNTITFTRTKGGNVEIQVPDYIIEKIQKLKHSKLSSVIGAQQKKNDDLWHTIANTDESNSNELELELEQLENDKSVNNKILRDHTRCLELLNSDSSSLHTATQLRAHKDRIINLIFNLPNDTPNKRKLIDTRKNYYTSLLNNIVLNRPEFVGGRLQALEEEYKKLFPPNQTKHD